MDRLKKFLLVAFIGLSFVRMAGYALSIPSVEGLGFILGFSPLPLAFSHRSGHEDFQLQGTFHYQESNAKKEIALKAELTESLPGWWLTKNVLVIGALYSPRFPPWMTAGPVGELVCQTLTAGHPFQLKLAHRLHPERIWNQEYVCKNP